MAMSKDQLAKAQAAFDADHSIGRRRLVKVARCSDYAADAFLKSRRSGSWDGKGSPAAETPGVPVKEFTARFDYEAVLRATIKRLCSDRFVADADIRRESGIQPTAFRAAASLPEFSACQIKDSGVTWWSTRKNVDDARAQARKWGVNK